VTTTSPVRTQFGERSTAGGSVAASIRASTGNEAVVVSSRADSDGRHGVAAYALDEGNAERLWEMSERLTAG
jgi:hypothetical protein